MKTSPVEPFSSAALAFRYLKRLPSGDAITLPQAGDQPTQAGEAVVAIAGRAFGSLIGHHWESPAELVQALQDWIA